MTGKHGRPIWFELSTVDQQAAATFYERVVGWRTAASPAPEHGGYAIASAPDGEGIAGIMTPPPGSPGLAGWTIYFGTDDIQASVAQVGELGGTIAFGPVAIPHVGDFAVVRDPQGISFCILQPSGDDPGSPFSQGPGAPGHAVWIELATPDPDAAFAFYGELFGWTRAGAMPMGDMGDYAFIAAGELRPGAVMPTLTTGAPARWNVYFLVPDIDVALATSQAEGGRTIFGPDQIPGGDYSAHIVDRHGDQVGLVGPRTGAAA